MSSDLKQLRKSLRQQRRRISRYEQRQSESKVVSQLRRQPAFQQSKHIGIYLHAFGEIHTKAIISLCFSLKKQVYLPMICNMNHKLVWVKVSQPQYRQNRFSHHPLGMKEPMQTRGLSVKHLDLLIMPLLACDPYGTRIGMGGGYYDRTLAQTKIKPIRLGLAHDFQYLQQELDRQPWDQALDYLLTPSKTYCFRRI